MLTVPILVQADSAALSLADAISLALRNNLDIRVIRVELNAINDELASFDGWLEAIFQQGLSEDMQSYLIQYYLTSVSPRSKVLTERREQLQTSLTARELRVDFEVQDAYHNLQTLISQQAVQEKLLHSLKHKLQLTAML